MSRAKLASGVITLWHRGGILDGNWAFSAQLENRRCRDTYFELGIAVLGYEKIGTWLMVYDAATVQMLREVLDEVLSSPSFTVQRQRTAVEVAERILKLAAPGERHPENIKRHLRSEFFASDISKH